MKNLNEYIKEGLFDDVDKLDGKNGLESNYKQLKKEITDWICSNYYNQPGGYKSNLVKKRDLQINMETTPPTVNYDSKNPLDNRLYASHSVTSLNNEGMFQWGTVVKDFICSNSKIETLEGSPKEVGGRFYCENCRNLVSLEGVPEKVTGFSCSRCSSLKSLKGCPKEVKDYFNCSKCEALKSLEGCPKVVDYFNCKYCLALTDLEGGPEKVSFFDCSDCHYLKSLKGAPKEVIKSFDCTFCRHLKTLEYAPKEVGECFDCRYCRIMSDEDEIRNELNLKCKILCGGV